MTSFVISPAELHDAAAWAARVIPSRPAVPILGGLILDASEQGLTVSGYDYETSVSVAVPSALVTEPGRVLVSGRLLASVAAATAKAKADVKFTSDGATTTVTAGRSEWSLPQMPIEDYPALPDLGDPVGGIEAGVLRAAIGRAQSAVGKDDSLPMLTGIRMESSGEELTLVATDRFRVAATTVPWKPAAGAGPLEVLVPKGLLDQASRALGGDTDVVGVYAGGGSFGVATDTHRVIGRLLDAQFPKWRQLMPPEPGDRFAVLDVPATLRAVEQVMAMVETQIVVEFDEAAVTVTSGGSDRGKARAVADLHELVGGPITIAFNPGYLRDALAGLGSDRATAILGASPSRPVLFVPGGGAPYRHLLMPVRLA